MRISKWHDRGRADGKPRKSRRDANGRSVTESHWIVVDGELFERLESMAKSRRTTVNRLVDGALNAILAHGAM
jgi:predicted HicB family RNase H-like nuclease